MIFRDLSRWCGISLCLILSMMALSACGDEEEGTSGELTPEQICTLFGVCSCQNQCTVGQQQCIGALGQTCLLQANGCTAWQNDVDSTRCQSNPSQCTETCTPNELKCDGNNIMVCQLLTNGCPTWLLQESCSNGCAQGQCQAAQPCTPGTHKCYGRTLQTCVQDGTGTRWDNTRTCDAYCKADPGVCTEDLPACKITNGSLGTILQWTDGDTLWVRARSDNSTCNEYEKDPESGEWKNIRFDIRVEGIDAPECTKDRNEYKYYTCIQDTKYTANNERMGYESWAEAVKMLPYQANIIIGCDTTLKDGTCGYDATRKRRLAYIGYELNNASYDFSTEIARKGLAFANTEFIKTTTKMDQICKAQNEAISKKVGLWSLASTQEAVLKLMNSDKQKNLSKMFGLCSQYK